MAKYQFGLVGLAVMGQNLVLNIESRGYSVAVFNRTKARTDEFMAKRTEGKNIGAAATPEELVSMLETPRRIMIMVKAGEPVDSMIGQFVPFLDKGDLLIDGGNSHFPDTTRRSKELAEKGINFIGTGVSGGEEGALRGPSIMPGGQRDAYEMVAPIFEKITAQTDDGPCVTYLGPDGAGHYVKMVHNGIEYGDMQLIAEAYDIMRTALGMSAAEMHDVFAEWKTGPLDSYLMDITADILNTADPETGGPLVDLILDKAGQKGTGKWTSQSALDLGVPTPTINAAVESRIMSAFKDERVAASKILKGTSKTYDGDRAQLIGQIHDGLYASKITSYAQGLALIKWAGVEHGWTFDFSEIARIWKGGCIIRAALLGKIMQAFKRTPDLVNLMIDEFFTGELARMEPNWRVAVSTAQSLGVPCLAMAASLAYYDAYRRESLPANMTQAQRDYFGAHTFERVDGEGLFHHQWT